MATDGSTESTSRHDDHDGAGPVHLFDALLFDMDGTLIDSTAAIVKHWHE